jgi:hypothetical protein
MDDAVNLPDGQRGGSCMSFVRIRCSATVPTRHPTAAKPDPHPTALPPEATVASMITRPAKVTKKAATATQPLGSCGRCTVGCSAYRATSARPTADGHPKGPLSIAGTVARLSLGGPLYIVATEGNDVPSCISGTRGDCQRPRRSLRLRSRPLFGAWTSRAANQGLHRRGRALPGPLLRAARTPGGASAANGRAPLPLELPERESWHEGR